MTGNITKLMPRILMNRTRRTRPEIGKEQRGFVKETGTRNPILIIRKTSERLYTEYKYRRMLP